MNQKEQVELILTRTESNLLGDIIQITELKQQESKLSDYLVNEADELWQIASENLKLSNRARYLKRLAKTIAENESLAKCFETPKGKMSIVKAMQKAIELGVMPGEDAYLIPYGEGKSRENNWNPAWYRADLQPMAEAYMRICLSEPNPLFRKIDYGLVYENDPDFKIDFGTGFLEHNPARKNRGEIDGAWVRFWPADKTEQPIVKYWDIEAIEKVRDNHSPTWKVYMREAEAYRNCVDGKTENAVLQPNGNYKVGNKYVNKPSDSSNPWRTDKPQMILKTVLKGESKRYARMKPGLERIIDLADDHDENKDDPDVQEPVEDINGISSKADKVINDNLLNLELTKNDSEDELTEEEKRQIIEDERKEGQADFFDEFAE